MEGTEGEGGLWGGSHAPMWEVHGPQGLQELLLLLLMMAKGRLKALLLLLLLRKQVVHACLEHEPQRKLPAALLVGACCGVERGLLEPLGRQLLLLKLLLMQLLVLQEVGAEQGGQWRHLLHAGPHSTA